METNEVFYFHKLFNYYNEHFSRSQMEVLNHRLWDFKLVTEKNNSPNAEFDLQIN